jgi:hypothetical protein
MLGRLLAPHKLSWTLRDENCQVGRSWQ